MQIKQGTFIIKEAMLFPLKRKTFRFSSSRGQVLIEVLVAVGILTIGFLGIVTLLNRALSLNRVVADNFTATYLAAEGIEVTKNILDANILQSRPWNSGMAPGDYEVDPLSTTLETYSDRTLAFDAATGLYTYTGVTATPFRRKIIVSPVGDGSREVRINAEVVWVTRGGAQSRINLEDHFYNWR